MFKDIFKSRFNNLIGIVSLVLVLGGVIWSYLALRVIDTPIIIQYSSFSGINRVGYIGDLVKVGIFGIVVIFVNFLISGELHKRNSFLGRLGGIFTLFLSILIFIYFAAIISVN